MAAIPKILDSEQIREMYWDQELTTAQIGQMLGCSRNTVCKAMRTNGIPMRNGKQRFEAAVRKGRGIPSHRSPIWSENPSRIKKLYWDQKLSLPRIARLTHSTVGALRNFMTLHGIPVRSVSEGRRAEISGHWKAGIYKGTRGYVRLNVFVHLSPNERQLFAPMIVAAGKTQILEHRLVVARILGRPLKSTEIVHHLNGIKHDNRSENLLLTSGKRHSLYIRGMRKRIRQLEERIEKLEAERQMDLPLAQTGR